ncbi:MAG: hypothetical protein CMF48_06160 [Legionellales bacterium]|nr:hypothetical protein [Legionellales bacterium]|tara:strand:- start:1865 stop:2791 length:927 start_codon:yes stop_codon:yes gene_type:complete
MDFKQTVIAGVLATVSTVAFADDISRSKHLNQLTEFMGDLDAAAFERDVALSSTEAPSLEVVAERSETLPQSLAKAADEWSNKMKDEVRYGLGLKSAESPNSYIKNWGKDNKAVDASKLLGVSSISRGDSDSIVRLIRNMTMPFPGGGSGLTPEEAEELERQLEESGNELPESTADDREKEAYNYVAQAAMSAAQHSLTGMYSRRIPDGSSPSVMEVMDTEALYRIEDEDWHLMVATAPTEALLRELIHISAYQTWMQHQQYLQNERIEALLATGLGLQSQMTAAIRATQEMSAGASSYSPQQAGALD